MKKVTLLPLAALTLAASTLANAQSTLVIDSWRSDDAVWNEKLSQPSTSTTGHQSGISLSTRLGCFKVERRDGEPFRQRHCR